MQTPFCLRRQVTPYPLYETHHLRSWRDWELQQCPHECVEEAGVCTAGRSESLCSIATIVHKIAQGILQNRAHGAWVQPCSEARDSRKISKDERAVWMRYRKVPL